MHGFLRPLASLLLSAYFITTAFASPPKTPPKATAKASPKPTPQSTQSEQDKKLAQMAARQKVMAQMMFTTSRDFLKLQKQQAQEEANKKMVVEFYQRFFGDKDITAADQYLAPSYIQHNPLAATGRDAVKQFFTPFFANPAIPKTKIDIRRVAADGDLVWLHIRSQTTGTERAVVDIFRVQDGKIVEHWDVIQPVPRHLGQYQYHVLKRHH